VFDFTKKNTPAREQLLNNLMELANEVDITNRKHLTTNLSYIKSSINNMLDDKMAGVVQFDQDGNIIGAAGVDAILKDALHINNLGGLGAGGGKAALKEVMQLSKKLKKQGYVELYSIGDPKTIDWYSNHGFESIVGARDGRMMRNYDLGVMGFSESLLGENMKYPVYDRRHREGETVEEYLSRVGGQMWQKADESDGEYAERIVAQREFNKAHWSDDDDHLVLAMPAPKE
jgi:hypothetical protein